MDPVKKAGDALRGGDRGAPIEIGGRAAHVGDKDLLVARPPIGVGNRQRTADQLLDQGSELSPDGEGKVRAAAQIVDPAGGDINVRDGHFIGIDEIVDMELYSAYLL